VVLVLLISFRLFVFARTVEATPLLSEENLNLTMEGANGDYIPLDQEMEDVQVKKPKSRSEGRHMLMNFDEFPLYLRKGPWSPVAYAYLLGAIITLLYAPFSGLISSSFYLSEETVLLSAFSTHPRIIAGVCGVYMVGVLLWMFHTVGYWPLVSYTMISWVLLTFRHLLRAADGPLIAREALRFPAVVGTVTRAAP